MDKQSADILRRAKALIDRPEKWCRFIQRDFSGRMCAIGAIIAGEGKTPMQDNPHRGALTTLSSVLPHKRSDPIASWNNDPDTTHADVMAAFDKAIALAEGRISDAEFTARFISDVVESVKSQEVAEVK